MEKSEAYLWKEKISKLLLSFSIPCIISFLVNALYNIVDQIFIGRWVWYLANWATNIVFPLTMICLWCAFLFWDWAASFLSIKLWEKKNEEGSADRAAACFGNLLAEIFAFTNDEWEIPLRKTGFYLGKYIYLLDAYDDLEDDETNGSFNPLLPIRARMSETDSDFNGYVRTLLTMQMASCCRAFEALPIVENIDILRNILYAGVWTKFEEIFAKRTSPAETAEASADS